ncbi:hypothetical protein BDN67DRAFT_418781 [Paxillus ammoniavirescens]|nr:hypothetical protein BDN67DRAFT_418781 [Paxillus ammoniavirescens]
MSELDADLYGDLYGNDETDFSPAVDSHEAKIQVHDTTEASAETPAPPTARLPEPKQDFKPTTLVSQPIKSEPSAPPVYQDHGAAQAQSALSQNAPQQIPTYQQPSDYSTDISRPGAYDHPQMQLMAERSIRPSEMKDEG